MSNKLIHERDIVDIAEAEILVLEPGPELDLLVAQNMLGEIRNAEISIGRYGTRSVEGNRITARAKLNGWPKGEWWIWNPSQDANDALVVWRALPDRDANGNMVFWKAYREFETGRVCMTVEAQKVGSLDTSGPDVYEDFCSAVCRAYLWAVKRWGVPK